MIFSKKDTNFKFNLGDEAKDVITGYTGVIVSRTQWLHNCNTYALKSRELKEGIPRDNLWFDEPQLELITEKVFQENRRTGGLCMPVPATNR